MRRTVTKHEAPIKVRPETRKKPVVAQPVDRFELETQLLCLDMVDDVVGPVTVPIP